MEDEELFYQELQIGDYVRNDGRQCTIIDKMETTTGTFYKTSDDGLWHTEASLVPICLLSRNDVVADMFANLLEHVYAEGPLDAQALMELAEEVYGITFLEKSGKSIDNADDVWYNEDTKPKGDL